MRNPQLHFTSKVITLELFKIQNIAVKLREELENSGQLVEIQYPQNGGEILKNQLWSFCFSSVNFS